MGTLGRTLLSGVLYTGIGRYSGLAISLVVTGILARVLLPEDFGIVTIATVIVSFFNVFADIGFSPAIIQRKDLDGDDLSNIFSFTVWSGAIISALFMLCAPLIAGYYGSPLLATICRLLSVNLFFASASIVPNALFYRDKDFKYIAFRSVCVQLAGGIVSVIVALRGGGVYALLINPILSGSLIFAASVRKYPQRLRFTFGIASIRKIFAYSAWQFLFNIIYFFSRNLDKLLIGKYMSMELLGYYEKSYRLMTLPLQNITQVITPVIHPVFSDFQDDIHRLAHNHERIIRLLAFIGFPLSVLLHFTAGELVLILFGGQWAASVPIVRILTFSVGVQVVLSSSGAIFQAANDTRSLFVCGLFSAVLNISGVMAGIFVFHSLHAIAWCICVSFTINFFQCYHRMYRVTFRRKQVFYLKQLLSPVLLSVLLVPVLYLFSTLPGVGAPVSLVAKCAIVLFVSMLYIQLAGEYDVLLFLRRRFGKRRVDNTG